MALPVLELLDRKGLSYKLKSDDEAVIVCPNAANHHGGTDSIESFRINLDGRGGYCFACGFAKSPEGLMRWLCGEDLDDLEKEVLAARAKVGALTGELESEIYQQAHQVFFPSGIPWDEDGYRGISLETYHKLGAVRVSRGRYENRIAFPIKLNGELIGVDARALAGQEPKYLRNKHSTCKENWLYPFDVVKEMLAEHGYTYVLIGEGLFHAVNPIDKGFPALTFFGVNNFTLSKVTMLMGLGVDEVIYFPDKDKAGYTACETICCMLEPWFDVTVADVSSLPMDVAATEAKGKEVYLDLGDLSVESIQKCIENRKQFVRGKLDPS